MSMAEKQNSQTFQDFNQSILKPKTKEEISAIVKECLSQISKALQATVQSLVTIKTSVITETGTADVAFKKL